MFVEVLAFTLGDAEIPWLLWIVRLPISMTLLLWLCVPLFLLMMSLLFILSVDAASSCSRSRCRAAIYSMAFCSVFTLDRRFERFSIGTHLRSLANWPLTACTLRRSRAFRRATRWGGFSRWGTCLYVDVFFLSFLTPSIVSRNDDWDSSDDGVGQNRLRQVNKKPNVHVNLVCMTYEKLHQN